MEVSSKKILTVSFFNQNSGRTEGPLDIYGKLTVGHDTSEDPCTIQGPKVLCSDGSEYTLPDIYRFSGSRVELLEWVDNIVEMYLNNIAGIEVTEPCTELEELKNVVWRDKIIRDRCTVARRYANVTLGRWYSLYYATEDEAFYMESATDEYLVVSSKGEIVTNYECFFFTALSNDLKKVKDGSSEEVFRADGFIEPEEE